MKLIRFILLLLAIFVFTPWLASYAYGFSNGGPGHETVHIEVAAPSTAPGATFYGKAIGSVTPGDLFYIDTTADTGDITVNLYLTNAHELTPCLRYLIMKVGIYFESSDGQWMKTSLRNGKPTPDTFITLRNSPVSFTLAGEKKYRVTIDSGSFYCITTSTNKGSLSPQFYITAEST